MKYTKRANGRQVQTLESMHGSNALIETLCEKTGKIFLMHHTSCIDPGAFIGESTKIWHYTHIMAGAIIGDHVNIGQGVMVADGAIVGDGCKIQNNVSIYNGVTIGKNTFLGPSCVFTNVRFPRANVNQKDKFQKTIVGNNVTIGANATLVCGITIADDAFIAAGAVITEDVSQGDIVAGVPARQIGHVNDRNWTLKHKVLSTLSDIEPAIWEDDLAES